MSKYVTYIDFNDIEKIQIYAAKGAYTAEQLRTRIGCDYIINGGLYNMSNMKPLCQLKIDGKVLANDGYGYYSACFNDDPKTYTHDVIPTNTAKWKNAIACVAFKNNGVVGQYTVDHCMDDPAISYATNRTAIGKKDGKLALYIGTDDMTSLQLFNYLNGLGWSDILMWDGGGSTQGYLGSGKRITSSRKVHNYICVFLKKSDSSPVGSDNNTNTGTSDNHTEYVYGKNPYPYPTRAIKYGMKGNDVKWMQYQMNVHGHPLNVDGSCGPASLSAIKQFQKDHDLTVDGSCGLATRTELNKRPDAEPVTTYRTDNNPYKVPTVAVKYGMKGDNVRWMQWMLNAHGYPVDVDGSYGPDSLSKLKEYQGDHNLEVDGSCGPATRAMLLKDN